MDETLCFQHLHRGWTPAPPGRSLRSWICSPVIGYWIPVQSISLPISALNALQASYAGHSLHCSRRCCMNCHVFFVHGRFYFSHANSRYNVLDRTWDDKDSNAKRGNYDNSDLIRYHLVYFCNRIKYSLQSKKPFDDCLSSFFLPRRNFPSGTCRNANGCMHFKRSLSEQNPSCDQNACDQQVSPSSSAQSEVNPYQSVDAVHWCHVGHPLLSIQKMLCLDQQAQRTPRRV